jgi:transcription termination factor NusB
LERATISFAMNELLFNDENFPKVVINQTINFSKSYLGKNKYKYLNKILDTVLKENLNQKK